MPLIVLIVSSALLYALFEIFANLAGGKINSWLAAVLYNGIGSIIPLIIYYASASRGRTTTKGIIYSSLAGIAILCFSVLFARIFNRGGNLTYVIPTIYGIAIVISCLFGWVYSKDKISLLQIVGIGLVIAGVTCIVAAKVKPA